MAGVTASSVQKEGIKRDHSQFFLIPRMSCYIKDLRKRLSSTSIVTYLLFCVFGAGSWVALNGLWAELPILLVTQPECYKLATALTLIFQVANVGPLTYSVVKIVWGKLRFKDLYLEVAGIFVILVIGVISSILLGVFWDKTIVIGTQSSSIVLYVLAFFLALVDCTSSVVFVPFMKHFPSQYLSALYIGEGMSGLLPSTIALIQGSVNNSLTCGPNGQGVPFSNSEFGVLFSPNIFFSLLGIIMVICGVAFIGILLAPSSRRELFKKHRQEVTAPATSETTLEDIELPCLQGGKKIEETSIDEDESPLLDNDEENHAKVVKRGLKAKAKQPTCHKLLYVLWKQRTPLFCLAVLSFVLNGALPSISSYAFGSYSNLILHLAINLGLLMNPLAAFTFMIIPSNSKMLIAIFTGCCCVLGTYILINTFKYGVLVTGTAGGVLIVSCIIIYTIICC